METVKVKSGVRTEMLTLVKQVKTGKWSYVAKPIPKGTEVEVTITTEDYKDRYYTVKHPSCLGINIMVDGTYFKHSRVKAELKVGDEFWFASIYSMCIWKDKIIKTTSRYAYFEVHHSIEGIYKIDLCDFSMPCHYRRNVDILMVQDNIISTIAIGDRVNFSKNKIDVQRELLSLIKRLKIDKEKVIDKIAKEHVDKIKEYQALEEQESEIKKQMIL